LILNLAILFQLQRFVPDLTTGVTVPISIANRNSTSTHADVIFLRDLNGWLSPGYRRLKGGLYKKSKHEMGRIN
jgi:hypothetical protein